MSQRRPLVNLGFYEIGGFEGHTDGDSLIGRLYSKGIRSILSIPFNTTHGKGVLACPLQPNPTSPQKPTISALKKHQSGKYSILITFANLVGNAIEAADSHLTAEGAQKLIAHIGHEVTTPAASLGQVSIKTMYELQDRLGPGHAELKDVLRERITDLKREMQTMGTTMQVATLVAQTNQRLRMHFRDVNLSNLVQTSGESVSQTYKVYDPQGNERPFKIALAPSCAKLGSVVCDADLIKVVLINAFKNAAKYSLPRYRGGPMEIAIFGQPQSGMTILQIRDWGFGIPPDEFESIFRPYTRGSVTDRKKVIPGMGLGLYIARRIMLAHQGQILCRSSERKLDSGAQRADWEGYETTFEIRLTHGLKEGISEFAREDWL